MNKQYVIITPVKDEEKHIEQTINSVLNQTIKPVKWIIVNDRSTDRTGEIINKYESKHSWIKGIETKANSPRKMGGQVALMHGLDSINVNDYDYFIRMDGDVTFEKDFFEKIFKRFEENQKLGIASGVCYVQENGKLVEEKNPHFHTRGPLKIYRKECYNEIGGLDPNEGWDTIDEVKANMLGWKTQNFPELKVIHLRKTQTASGALTGQKYKGRVSYYTGYHPLFALLRSFRVMYKKPYILGGLSMLSGFLEGYIKRLPRVNDPALISYLRKQQMNRLLRKNTIWH